MFPQSGLSVQQLMDFSKVKFIKFFAWEERWIQRALDAREVEMQWMIKGSVCRLVNHHIF